MKRSLIIILVLVPALWLLGCRQAPEIADKPVRVSVYTIPALDHQVNRVFNGVARAQDLTALAFRVEGRIARIMVTKGQAVKAGDVLAILEKKDFQIVLNDRRARLDVTRKQAERSKVLVDKKLMAQAEYDQMNAEYLVARAEARQAELMLDYAELRAPFNGVIGDVFLESFENVQPGTAVMSIHRTAQIEVDVQVPDLLIAVSRKADPKQQKQSFDVAFEAFPNETFVGRLLEVSTEKDPVSQTYVATIAVDLPPGVKVLEGMPAKVTVDLGKVTYTYSREYLIPTGAVVMRDGSDIDKQDAGVWLYEPQTGTVTFKNVTLGVIVGQRIEVRAGLADGQQVVVQGQSRLVDGQKVELVQG
ncbi:efflux RND transporter periplasmic adaptor subunit [Shewanella litorisediminis]|uniref:Efflux RND transporter periplasmic adaptor subunit n=1 Tax=Shewanella litorisediminis TaxID=1173586 RepID=A0ABX7G540_9GAMM|nr:efflux RND transporter periplasmic adaptor subunit [Shewanella litorisediminis]MCL2918003.1 efflux RND transporter periplasmic adaptor subunit [Shewanella litorisediminis]QRH02436.1 efflux RND transporter periplasmic adaptor subunit [Shewanella litorisediminis]